MNIDGSHFEVLPYNAFEGIILLRTKLPCMHCYKSHVINTVCFDVKSMRRSRGMGHNTIALSFRERQATFDEETFANRANSYMFSCSSRDCLHHTQATSRVSWEAVRTDQLSELFMLRSNSVNISTFFQTSPHVFFILRKYEHG